MKTICVYLNNAGNQALNIINAIGKRIPMFFSWEPVEMDYIEVKIMARQEDIATVENAIAGLV